MIDREDDPYKNVPNEGKPFEKNGSTCYWSFGGQAAVGETIKEWRKFARPRQDSNGVFVLDEKGNTIHDHMEALTDVTAIEQSAAGGKRIICWRQNPGHGQERPQHKVTTNYWQNTVDATSFPPPWAEEWGDNSQGVYARVGGITFSLMKDESGHKIWLSVALSDAAESLKTIQDMLKNVDGTSARAPQFRIALPEDAQELGLSGTDLSNRLIFEGVEKFKSAVSRIGEHGGIIGRG